LVCFIVCSSWCINELCFLLNWKILWWWEIGGTLIIRSKRLH
jgi:hypothetical protein